MEFIWPYFRCFQSTCRHLSWSPRYYLWSKDCFNMRFWEIIHLSKQMSTTGWMSFAPLLPLTMKGAWCTNSEVVSYVARLTWGEINPIHLRAFFFSTLPAMCSRCIWEIAVLILQLRIQFAPLAGFKHLVLLTQDPVLSDPERFLLWLNWFEHMAVSASGRLWSSDNNLVWFFFIITYTPFAVLYFICKCLSCT